MNFFQTPNDLWDMDLNVYQRAILIHIVRKTIGWGKTKDGISISQFSKDLQISKPKVIQTLKELIEIGLIEKEQTKLKNGSQSYNVYSISRKTIEKYNESDKSHLQGVVNDIDRGGKSHLQGVVNDIDRQNTLIQNTSNTKYTNTKEKNIKKEKFKLFIDAINEEFKKKRLLTFKSKINNTKYTREAFELISDDDLEDVIKSFAQYVSENKNMAARLDKFMLAYAEDNIGAIQYGQNTPTIAQKGQNNGVSAKTKANIPIAQVLEEYGKDRASGATKEIATLRALEKVDWGLQKKLKEAIDIAEYRMYQSQLDAAPLDILDEELPF